MKYTFKDADNNQQSVMIPDEEIATSKKEYGLSNKESIQLYLVQNGYNIGEDVAKELTDKIKSGKKDGSTKTRKSPKRKEDPTKRAIINSLFDYLMMDNIKLPMSRTMDSVEITNPERVIAFTIGNDNYELTLSKKRK